MMHKAVIFDMDGTLLDSIDDMADSMNLVLERHSYSTHDIEKYKYFIGDGVHELVCRALPKGDYEEVFIQNCMNNMKEIYGGRWAVKSKPYVGILDLLQKLGVRGTKMAVLSNKPHEFMKEIMSHFFADYSFDYVLGQRPDVPIKPDPTAALEIAEIIGVSPKECLFVGDTNTDMQTANNAGMFAVGVSWGFRERDELLKHGAQAVIDNPLDILKILG